MKPKILSALAIVSAAYLFGPSPALAQAKITYSAYEGPPVIKTGEGGTKITKNGIDYWTSGTPPRRYQIVGMVSDKRDEEWDGGHAIGSPSIARKVKQAGGDAVIVQSQDEKGSSGGAGFANGMFAFMAMGGSKTMTVMLAVKYLPDEAVQIAPRDATPPSP